MSDIISSITFIDTEVSTKSNHIVDFGAAKVNGESLHTGNHHVFQSFLKETIYLCGHNIIQHDLKYLKQAFGYGEYGIFDGQNAIDTLYLSALLFPKRPYHALVKDDKLQTEELNNPLNDAVKAKELFLDEVQAFLRLPEALKSIYYTLLKNKPGFNTFFKCVNYSNDFFDIEIGIKATFLNKICSNVSVREMAEQSPVELAYCLAVIYADDISSIMPRWIVMQYPKAEALMNELRGIPCDELCSYCSERLDAVRGLKTFFGFDGYRDFDGVPLQEQAVQAAIRGKSLLAVFPTGGGKSITFQIPALMAGRNTRGLTIVISPLQSLMKDQVDNLEKNNITDAVTINGLLDPIERAESIRRVEEGEASILYISPESLRSNTIERLLCGRKIARFVIDEAHCFSAWGQDFRVDYLYIAEFIRNLCRKKNLEQMIPVSCFTATAKQNVIEDIKEYFRANLNLELELYTAGAGRKNLSYKVIEKDENSKYDEIRNLLEYKSCPTIIYVSRTKKAGELCARLNKDGYPAKTYHGKMDKKEKSANQDAFTRGEVNIMVATSAFGMGVDKKDVGMVIHYDISDTLENYVQEAGRAGRDESITAECFVLFNDEDLNKHFLLLNQTKISMQEIQQVWKAIKDATRTRTRMSNSVLEIARSAGWDETVIEIETRVKTAIAALEDAGYLKRGQNMPRVYADSIKAKTAAEAIDKIHNSPLFYNKEEENAVRIIKKLISSRSRKHAQNETPESRIDYISDDLGIDKSQVIHTIQMLREADILADARDLTAYIDESGTLARAINTLDGFIELEKFLLSKLTQEPVVLQIKEINEQAQEQGVKKPSPDKIKTIINYWVIKGYIKRELSKYSKNHIKIELRKGKDTVVKELSHIWDIARFILEYLYGITKNQESTTEFSVLELKENFEFEMQIFQKKVSTLEVEAALLYLSRIGALKLEGGFLVTYNALSIERIEKDNKIRYKVDDYKRLKEYYRHKTQMIHIVGEYARKMMEDYQSALQFTDDYFKLDYKLFLQKYFKGSRSNDIERNLSPEKFKKLFGELSPSQLKIINDKDSEYIVVAAGPGSGKTKILVHKLASLLLMEDTKHEQLLMLTFSRAAASEFKKRLLDLIGNAAHFVEIKTFHSYCFDLLGRVGSLEKASNIVEEAAILIENGEVENSRVTKTVLVIDEAQDMDEKEARLMKALINRNDDMRVIAVGDDDQNIYAFRGSDSKYMQELMLRENSMLYELVENYRSKANIVHFSNTYADMIQNRMKAMPIMPVQSDNGEIHVIQYKSNQLIVPVVNEILDRGIVKSTCIMTVTNEEALQISGLLQAKGIPAKLIQSNESYEVYNLLEIRYFIEQLELKEKTYIISNEMWEKAKQRLKNKYAGSRNYQVCEQIIKTFEEVNNKYKYKSDLIVFLQESKEEDFYNEHRRGICVSTIHKSKGREFDHVIIMLNDFTLSTEEAKRQLYVGMTRAKNSLTIHYNNTFLEIQMDNRYGFISNIDYKKDYTAYDASNKIMVQLGYKDTYLSYFANTQDRIEKLVSGNELRIDEEGCLDNHNNRILIFSNRFKKQIAYHKSKGYHISKARVNYIIYWRQEDAEQDIKVVFPEVEFVK